LLQKVDESVFRQQHQPMKSLIRIVAAVVVVLVLVVVGLLVVPRVLYMLPPFQSWVAGQIDKQSGGNFQFESIKGDAMEARLSGSVLDMTQGASNVMKAEFDEMTATFELLPLAMFKLNLKEVHTTGGKVTLNLTGGDYDKIRFPVSSEIFSMTGGVLEVQNLQGHAMTLQKTDLDVSTTEQGMVGSFQSPSGTVGTIAMTNISGSFDFDESGLQVSVFKATLPGESALDVEGAMVLAGEGMPMKDVHLTVKTEQVKTLLSSLGYSESFGGSAEVALTTSGRFRPQLKDLQGSGTAQLNGITAMVNLPSYPGFDGGAFFKELKQITGLSGSAAFELNADKVKVTSLDLANEQMKINGLLTIGYDKSVSGEQTLLTNPGLAEGMPDVAKGIFKKDTTGWTVIPFRFTGTTNEPAVRTNSVISKTLMNPVNAVKGVGGIFGGLFGGGKKAEAQPEATEPAEATPAQ
jgi:hypothetical protein